ncbi:DUF3558 domain-containing protein [Actinopolyspora mortivallis]|uniref:DUF3558 domain-containing protein n=1 Tax=Actinopolyspora mortivallis TaxID=33906 RepID=UPI0003829D95|nr:DUF3558 domain-containing protein [Actinopolyspora mortivallis]
MTASALLLGLTACSPGGSADERTTTSQAEPSEDALAGVDPCALLSETELNSFGLKEPGKNTELLPWVVGCDYSGDPISATLYRDTRNTVAASERKEVWAMFERTPVNGRPGATAITQGATQARICDVMFDAGNGMIQVQVSEPRLPDNVDECAEALKIAKKVEPKVPEPV